MLQVRNLTKMYAGEHGMRRLFSNLNFDLGRNDRIAILGRNGQGKSTLIKILGGVVPPTEGSVKWSMTSSWPLGFGGAFQGGLTGLDNIRFIARIYDKPADEMAERVEDFAQLGKQLFEPVRFYSTGMRARLSFGISLAIEFDCYLIDEVISVGDMLFRAKCQVELFDIRKHRSFIMASHDTELLRTQCEKAIIIDKGQAKLFDDIELAVDIYTSLCEEGRYLLPPEEFMAA
jgi:capsular polysaccharide transport system ATP-binding protein